MGSLTKGTLQGLNQGLVEMPLSGYQQTQESKERIPQVLLPGVMTVFPYPPASCPRAPSQEPLYAGLQRPLSDQVEPRPFGPGIILGKTQLPDNSSCAAFL